MVAPLVWNRIPDIILRSPRAGTTLREYRLYNIRGFLQYPIGVAVSISNFVGCTASIDRNDLIITGDAELRPNAYIELSATRGNKSVSIVVPVIDIETMINQEVITVADPEPKVQSTVTVDAPESKIQQIVTVADPDPKVQSTVTVDAPDPKVQSTVNPTDCKHPQLGVSFC